MKTQRTSFKSLLFDWDGTLANTASLHKRAFYETIQELAPDHLETFHYDSMRGASTKEVFERNGIIQNLQKLVTAKQTRYRTFIDEGKLEPMLGAITLVTWLKKNNVPLYLVTGGSFHSVQTALHALQMDHLFDGMITSEDVKFGKPKPDCYLLCLERYHLLPEGCLAIEDARDGVLSCHAAGLQTVGVHDTSIQNIVRIWFKNLIDFQQFMKKAVST